MDTNLDDIKHIRSMMERSTKFLSLSGLSGISTGVVALTGAYVAHLVLQHAVEITGNLEYDLSILAILVLLVAASCGFYFSTRKAKKSRMKFWMPVTVQILKDFLVPLVAGGLFCMAMLVHHSAIFIPATMLIFYGLALIAAGARTYRDIKILGAFEIGLGLLAALYTGQGLLFWAIGFGALHIIYGLVMYLKYDRQSAKVSES